MLAGADLLACSGSVVLALNLVFRGDIPIEHRLPYFSFLPVLAVWRVVMARA